MVITGERPPRRRRRRAAAGGRRGAVGEVHQRQDRAGLRRADLLRQGRHDRAAPDERDHGSGAAREASLGSPHLCRDGLPRPLRPQPKRRLSVRAPAQPEGPRGRSDSAGAVSRPPRPRRAATGRGVELHQSVHALRPPPGLQGQLREGCCTSATPKALELFHNVEEVKQSVAEVHEGARRVAVLRGRARRQLPSTCSSPARPTPLHTFHFGRQAKSDGLCLSDYVLDPDERRRRDHIALFVVTAGEGVRAHQRRGQGSGRVLQGARAPGAGHRDRRRLRRVAAPPHPRRLGLPRSANDDHAGALHLALSRQALQLRLPGLPESRRSAGLFELLRPEEIGVELTEGMMMEPEASVSALVFHHPDCAYFTAADEPEVAAAS